MRCRYCKGKKFYNFHDIHQIDIPYIKEKKTLKNNEKVDLNFGICEKCNLLQLLSSSFNTDISNYKFNLLSYRKPSHEMDILENVANFVNPKKILDIGCNDGKFFEEIDKYFKAEILGVEPNIFAFKDGKKKGKNIINSFFNNVTAKKIKDSKGTFDFIISRHVIEHVIDIRNFLINARSLLSDNGLFLIEIPNDENALLNGGIFYWEQHLSYFSEKNFENYLTENNFKVVNKRHYSFGDGCIVFFCKKNKNKKKIYKNVSLVDKYSKSLLKLRHNNSLLKKLIHILKEKKVDIYLYGAESRVTLLISSLNLQKYIDCIIDDRKELSNLYVNGYSGKIKSLDELNIKNKSVFISGLRVEHHQKIKKKIKMQINNFTYLNLYPSSMWSDTINKFLNKL